MLSKNKQFFAEWLAVPKEMRNPRTQKELAGLLKIKPETLSRWKKEPDFQAAAFEKARTQLEVELPEILQVIAEKAKAGNYQFVKLALELTHKHSEKITVKQEVPEVGIEQWSALLEEVAQWEKERFGDGWSTGKQVNGQMEESHWGLD